MVIVLSVLICAALVGIDQFLKYLVVEYLKPIEYYDVIEGVLRLRYVENTGAVFGSFATHTMLLTVFSIVLLGFTIYFLYTNKGKSKLVNACLLLMISGGIGNIIDRIRLHYVVDYIEPTFVRFAVFNFADCLITVGAFLLIGFLIIDMIKDYKNGKKNDDCKTDEAQTDNDNEKVSMRRRRKTKKVGVEGDKEAAVFNAVITGKSVDSVLNEMELGVEFWDDKSKDEKKAENNEAVHNDSSETVGDSKSENEEGSEPDNTSDSKTDCVPGEEQ